MPQRTKQLFTVHDLKISFFLSFLWRCDPTRAMASSVLRFLDHIQRRVTVCRTPLDEWSVRRKDLYLTTHNIHNRQTLIPKAGFEPTISVDISAHYLTNGKTFEKTLLNIKYVCFMSLCTILVWNIFTVRIIKRDVVQMPAGLNVKYPLFLSDVNANWNFSTKYRKVIKYKIRR
jgi:hypothetical protein